MHQSSKYTGWTIVQFDRSYTIRIYIYIMYIFTYFDYISAIKIFLFYEVCLRTIDSPCTLTMRGLGVSIQKENILCLKYFIEEKIGVPI